MSNIEITMHLYRLFAAKDIAAIRMLFAETIEWKQMKGFPRGGTYVGADAIEKEVFNRFSEHWSDWAAIVTEYLDAGNDVIAIGYYEGVYRSTGRYVKADFVHRYTMSGGKIARFVQYTDTHLIAKAMENNWCRCL